MTLPAYSILMEVAVIASLAFWLRLARRDDQLIVIYLAGLTGAFIGAKVVYFAAEGWLHFGANDLWLQLATGKSILGALLGGYGAVELAKRWVNYRQPTGDWFATIVPVAVIIGRFGCLLHGCCLGERCPAAWYTLRDWQGLARWPAVPIEILFNLAAVAIFYFLRRSGTLRHQHFHLYLIGYGLFRFAHEFVRETPHVLGAFSVYQLAALAVAALGCYGFIVRQHALADYPPSISSICTQRLL
jgi:phosphatidylglycerol---prolipoprotein diacylglyceryl transferase